MEIVFLAQFDNGKQTGLKSWTSLVHAWRVTIEMGIVTFNFLEKKKMAVPLLFFYFLIF
jgi:hypothetical protein